MKTDGTTSLSFAIALSKAGAEISAIKTLAPSLAKRMQVSSPIPLKFVFILISLDNDRGDCIYEEIRAYPAAPVTIAFLP